MLNRLRVVRQVRYSLGNENSIDLVLFLNGIPCATAELKSDFTQGVDDAVDQYRFDRDPRPKGAAAEPLLSFPSGALVHFAVGHSAVRMTTRLAGAATRLDQPKISSIVNGRLDGFSTDRLMRFLNDLGCDVQISVSAPHPEARGHVVFA